MTAKDLNRAGRPKGSANIATSAARNAIALFVDNNAHRLQEWLDRIGEEDPKTAFNLFQSVIEYHIPKLARTEVAGDKDNPLKVEGNVTLTPSEAYLAFMK